MWCIHSSIRLCCGSRCRPAVHCDSGDQGLQSRPPPLLPRPAELSHQGPEVLQGGRRRHQPPARQLRRESQLQRLLLLRRQTLLRMPNTNAAAHALVLVTPNTDIFMNTATSWPKCSTRACTVSQKAEDTSQDRRRSDWSQPGPTATIQVCCPALATHGRQRTRQWEVRAAQVQSSSCVGSALVTSDTRAHSVVTSALAAAGGGGSGGSCSGVIGPGPAFDRQMPRDHYIMSSAKWEMQPASLHSAQQLSSDHTHCCHLRTQHAGLHLGWCAGPQVSAIKTLLTCHGDAHGPQLSRHLSTGAPGEVEHDRGGRPPQLVARRARDRQLLCGLLLQTCAQQPRCVGVPVLTPPWCSQEVT